MSKMEMDRDRVAAGIANRLVELEADLGDDVVEMITEMFKEDSVVKLESIKAAFASRDFDELERHAHSLRGSCANLGAGDMAEICGEIETKCENGETSDLGDNLIRLEDSLPIVLELIDEIVETRAS